MKKLTKLLLGLATLWPFFYMIFFFLFVVSAFAFIPGSSGDESRLPLSMALILPLHLFTMLMMVALTTIYIVNVFRNDRVEKDKKVLWAVVLFMGNMIAMPIYWYLYIWREGPAGGSPSRPALGNADASSWADDAKASSREPQYVPPSEPPNWR
jgi:hypothetical protein